MHRHLAVIALTALATNSIGAQTADMAQCFGFSFGTWSPPLDLVAAGHSPLPSSATSIKAPGGRDWAMDPTPNDTTLLLFPVWWSAGVQVTFPRRPRSSADTVAGHAIALVANGQVAPPRAPVRAWRVACR